MRVQLYATLTILSLTLNTVSSVGLFVLEGSPVTLTTTQHEDKEAIRDIKWLFNKTLTIVSYLPRHKEVEVKDLYKGRVEFDETDFSLTLKNPQRSDSGLYTAVVEKKGKDAETTASHDLSVLAPAVAPTLTVVSNWSNNDSCNVTLKCTGLNVSLISNCNGTFCSLEGGDRFLSISLNHTTVSCNHSNPVSWRQTIIALEPLCRGNKTLVIMRDHRHPIILASSLSLSFVSVIVIGTVTFLKKRKKGGAQIGPNTQSNNHAEQGTSLEMDPLPTSGGDNHYEAPMSPAKSNAAPAPAPAPTVYDVVQFNRHTDSSSTESAPVMSSSPETIYAVVKKKDGLN